MSQNVIGVAAAVVMACRRGAAVAESDLRLGRPKRDVE